MDWSRLRTLPIGAGQVDFEEFFSFLQKVGYDGTFTVEATAFNAEGVVDTDMLNRCFQYIREHCESGRCRWRDRREETANI